MAKKYPWETGGSADNVKVWDGDQETIRQEMQSNSRAWHETDDQAEKDSLHARNTALAALLGGDISFEEHSGTWSGTAKNGGNGGYPASASASASAAASSGGFRPEYPNGNGLSGGYGIQNGGFDGSFDYKTAPEYLSRRQQQIDALADQILGRQDFSYDPKTDPTYQQYAKSYQRGGQQAMEDTLAQVSARTGGLASSYATQAAQQGYDRYMAALADKVPELRQLAYEMYLKDIDAKRDDLAALRGLESDDYAKYLDRLGQYNTDRNFDYGAYRDSVSDIRYEDETTYARAQDQLDRQSASEKMAYQQAKDRAEALASVGDYSGYAELYGWTPEQTEAILQAVSPSEGVPASESKKISTSVAKDYAKEGVFTQEAIQALHDAGYSDEYLSTAYGYDPENPTGEDRTEYRIENQHGDSWVSVPGYGRLGYGELLRLVDSGEIEETIDGDQIRYKKKRGN